MQGNVQDIVTRYFELWAFKVSVRTLHPKPDVPKALFAVWMEVTDLVYRDPQAAWPVIRALIDQAPTDEALSYVAAGPLEDFLIEHGEEFLSELREAISKSRRFRRALAGVWGQRMADAVRKEIERIQEE